MRILIAIVCLLAFGAGEPEAGISYFERVRDVAVTAPDRQNYLVVDSVVWAHARADLADLRLYDGPIQVPFELITQLAASSSQESEVRIFNLVRRGDHTEFDLDVTPTTEYNRIRLVFDHKDFLVTANVEGRDALVGGSPAASPNPSTLFDFSREKLGSNSIISLPTWSFRYVRVRLSPGILPGEVQGATVAHLKEKQAHWTTAGDCHLPEEQPHRTIIHCEVSAGMPVDRIRFDVPSAQINFRRTVRVDDDQGIQLNQGAISRIRINRGPTVALAEDLAVRINIENHPRLVITIDNGDDPPLKLDAIQPESLERRIYFDPKGKTNFELYYGDKKLGAPVYDYAKFFHEEAGAAPAKLGQDLQNAAYSGRPENRPWSERHKGILWVAMLLAVALLAALAIRGLHAQPGSVA